MQEGHGEGCENSTPNRLPHPLSGEWPTALAVASCLPSETSSHATYAAALRTAAAGPPEASALAARAAARLRALASANGAGWAAAGSGGSVTDLGRGNLPATSLKLVDAYGVVLQEADSAWAVAAPGTLLAAEVVRAGGEVCRE